jgi:hypothetical protein
MLADHIQVLEDFYAEHAFDLTSILEELRKQPRGEDVPDLLAATLRTNGAEDVGPFIARSAAARSALRVNVPCWLTHVSSWNQISMALPLAPFGLTT